jgi:hypothetical protein
MTASDMKMNNRKVSCWIKNLVAFSERSSSGERSSLVNGVHGNRRQGSGHPTGAVLDCAHVWLHFNSAIVAPSNNTPSRAQPVKTKKSTVHPSRRID